MDVARLLRQVPMDKPHDRSVAVGGESDFDGAGPWGYRPVAVPAPGKDDAAIRHDLHVRPAGSVPAIELHPLEPTGARLQIRHGALPAHILCRVRQQREDRLRPGLHANLTLDGVLLVYGHTQILL